MRRTMNRPKLFFPLMCVKPRKSNVSGLPSPLRFRSRSAYLPTSIRRVFFWVEFQPKFPQSFPEILQKAVRIRLILKSQDDLIRIRRTTTSPCAYFLRQTFTQRSKL